MSTCKITKGVSLSCSANRQIGGTAKRMWFVTQLEGFSFTTDASGYITALDFGSSAAYEGLKRFTGPVDGHSGGYSLQVQEGGQRYFQHEVQISLLPDTPLEDEAIEEVISGDFPIILETNNGEFILYGDEFGMTPSEGTQNSGTTAASNISDVLNFTGKSKTKPKRIFDTDRATTLALLESYEV